MTSPPYPLAQITLMSHKEPIKKAVAMLQEWLDNPETELIIGSSDKTSDGLIDRLQAKLEEYHNGMYRANGNFKLLISAGDISDILSRLLLLPEVTDTVKDAEKRLESELNDFLNSPYRGEWNQLVPVKAQDIQEIFRILSTPPRSINQQTLPWQPASLHPKMFDDGEKMLVAVPLHEDSGGGYDFDVITINCDEGRFEIKCSGKTWGCTWLDVECFIPINKSFFPGGNYISTPKAHATVDVGENADGSPAYSIMLDGYCIGYDSNRSIQEVSANAINFAIERELKKQREKCVEIVENFLDNLPVDGSSISRDLLFDAIRSNKKAF